MEVDIISSLDHIVSNKSQNSLYISDSEKSEESISFICYNNKKKENETHTFPLETWNNYIQTIDSIHTIQCLKCNRNIEKNEYVKNGTFIYKCGDKIIERTNYVNGKLDGLYERFYLNGIHYERTNYKDGVYHGICEFWYDITGKKMKSMNFENGKLHGAYKYWDQNGKLVEDFYFNHGIRSDIFVKIPSKNPIDESNLDVKYVNINSSKIDENKESNNENMDTMFDLSKKKKKKDKKEKKEKKEKKDRNDSDSEDSDLEMEKI